MAAHVGVSRRIGTSPVPAASVSGFNRQRATIREARFEDYTQVAALYVRNGLALKSRSDWTDLWRNNPAYLRHSSEWPIGWVIEGESGDIVGSISNVPLEYSFRGKPLRAGAACSWAVDPDYRRYSMSMLDRLTNQSGVDLLISTTVSAAVEPAFRMFRWSRVPAGTWDKSAFWVTNHSEFMRIGLKLKSVPMYGLLTYPLSAALYGWDAVHRRHRRAAIADIECISGFDSRFDDFWRQWETENCNRLLAVRTRETLAWHFSRRLAKQDAWVLTASRQSRLEAYAIFDRHEDPGSGFRRVRLVDFTALRGCEDLFPAILNSVLKACRTQGIHILQTTGLWLTPSCMVASPRAHQRPLPSWSFYYRITNPELAEVLKNPAVWTPTSFDGDASL